jgi:hypothetical protein
MYLYPKWRCDAKDNNNYYYKSLSELGANETMVFNYKFKSEATLAQVSDQLNKLLQEEKHYHCKKF